MSSSVILGISSFYHDSAAALIVDGVVVAASQEERFTRKKQDPGFPSKSVENCIKIAGLKATDIDMVAFYDKPLIKFERLLETYHAFAPKGFKSFAKAIPVWIREKLFLKDLLHKELKACGLADYELIFPEHHLSHAASAFYPSPYEEAAILTVDGVGEWATTTICKGSGNKMELLKQINFPHSLGLLYSAFTYFLGFKVNSGEYKLMGLAPYGRPNNERTKKYIDIIYKELIKLNADGSFVLNMSHFNYATGLTMVKDKDWENLFGMPKRVPEDELEQHHMDLAIAIQIVTEEAVKRLAVHAMEICGTKNLCLAGGVALNCVANGKLLIEKLTDSLWIQPAAGDAGGALGAAYCGHYISNSAERTVDPNDSMFGSYLGPSFSDEEADALGSRYNAAFHHHKDFSTLAKETAKHVNDGKVIGWFQGRMEYGPRALGNRSIIGDPRSEEMQKRMNLKIKYRESFRPFAPSILEEKMQEYFDMDQMSPYMLLVAPIQPSIKFDEPEGYIDFGIREKLYHSRSTLPAITHVDYSARIQSVSKRTNPRYWEMINEFNNLSDCPIVVNTSFNVRGEPIVCTPEDAYRCFMRTEMDILVINNHLFVKEEQPNWNEKDSWEEEFVLD